MPTTISGTNGVDKVADNTTINEQFMQVQDQKSSGTAGGSLTASTWNIRTLNTTVSNSISGASLATNQITLPAGTYYIEAGSIGHRVDEHRTKIYNATDNSDILLGISNDAMFAASDASGSTLATTSGRFTLASEKAIELRHWISTSSIGTAAGGAASASGSVEIYSDVKIWRIA